METPYVIPILDDFVLKEKFKGDELIIKVIDWLDENPDIGVFYLFKHLYASQEKTEFEGFGLVPQKAQYKLSTGFGVWRKDYLNKCIKGFETPWEWEFYVSRKAWKFPEKEYALLNDQIETFIFTRGGVIWRGFWHPEARTLAEKYNVKIDFSIRGFMDEENPLMVYPMKEHLCDIYKLEFWKQFCKKVKGRIRGFLCSI